jgi:hypothetical protein
MSDQPGHPGQPSLSVGELIGWTQRESQTLLATAGAAEATALARGWPDTLAAAQNLLEAIPYAGTDDDPHPVGQHYLSVQVAHLSIQAARFNPLAPDGHPVMSEVADTLNEAAQLVGRNVHAWLPTNPDARQDAAVARVQVAETLSNLAHVTGREIRSYNLMATAADRANGSHGALPKALGTQTAERWLRVMDSHEDVLLGYVNRHRGELSGRRQVPPIPASAIGVQLAAWSTTALRRVADPQVSAFDLQRVAATEANILWVATALTAAAGASAQIDPDVAVHLHRRLDAAGTQWATTANQWGLLRTPGRGRLDHDLMVQARAMRTSLDRVTHNPNGWCSPTEIAARLAGTPITPLLRAATDGSHTLAEIYAQLPAEMHAARRLAAPAAAQLAIARGHGDLAAAVTDYPRYRDTVNQPGKPISLIHIATNRLHRLTPDTLTQLNTGGTALAEAATTAHRAVLVNTADPAPADSAPRSRVPITPAARPHLHQPAHRPQPGTGITP